MEKKRLTLEELNQQIDNLHPKTAEKLKGSDGFYRLPNYEEWMEDYGLGYFNRLCNEERGK